MLSDQLNSWKEVAQYLGCSIRTVQRWEAERGLPVRRIPGQRGAVFALRAEIDQWKTGSVVETTPQLGVRSERPAAGAAIRAWPIIGTAIVLAIVVVTAFAAFPLNDTIVHPSPASFMLEANTIKAHDAGRQLLWSHAFSQRVAALDLTWRPTIGDWAQRADIDGDGTEEVLVLVGHPVADETGGGVETLHAFSADGTLRWSYTPRTTLDYTSRRSSGPWVILDFEVIPGHGVWISFTDHVWWPSAVEEVDNAGRVRARFYQPGHVRVLRAIQEGDRTLVVAAGVNNEFAAASVALLDPNVVTTSPQEAGSAFTCRGCPPAAPMRYALLSPSPLSRIANRPYNTVTNLLVGPTLIASTYEADHANVLFSLTRDLRVLSAEPSDGYWSYAISKPTLLSEGQHAEVREWSAHGWTTHRIGFSTIEKATRHSTPE